MSSEAEEEKAAAADENVCEDHREQHSEECKRWSDKLLHDKRLFTQPDRNHRGECPICFLPMPLDATKSTFMPCCGQRICTGCGTAHVMSNVHDLVKAIRCVFCRTSPLDKVEYKRRKMERIEANDPAVLCHMGSEGYYKGDYDKALKYFTIAADFGDAEAQFKLGKMYMVGEGVEIDEEKAVYHYEKAAIGGHAGASYALAFVEAKNGNTERAVRHWIIAANLGCEYSMKRLLPIYKDGCITKEDYGATLRTHQAAIDATKSAQRDEAERTKHSG